MQLHIIIESKKMENQQLSSPSPLQGEKRNREMDVMQTPVRKSDRPVSNIFRQNMLQIQMKQKVVDLKQVVPMESEEEQSCNFTFQNLQEKALEFQKSSGFYFCFVISLIVLMLCFLVQDPRNNKSLYIVSRNVELLCNILFFLLFLVRVVNWRLHSLFWLFLDISTIICSFIGYGLEGQEIARYFKAIRTLRLIFIIKQIKILNDPASNLMSALAKIGNLLIPALFIIYVYAVIGLYTFSDFQYNRCRNTSNLLLTEDWTVYQTGVFLCGELECPKNTGQDLQCLNPIDYGVEPDERELINMTQGNGLLRYSNIFYAFLSTFKQTFVTGSSRLIILYKQALNSIFIQIYFFSFIYLISYIYLNIFYSLIITAEWDNNENEEDNKVQDMEGTIKIENNLIQKEPNSETNNKGITDEVKTKQYTKQGFEDIIVRAEDSQTPTQNEKGKKNQRIVEKKSARKRETMKKEEVKVIKKVKMTENPSTQDQVIKEGTMQLSKVRVFNIFDQIQEESSDNGMDQSISNLNGKAKFQISEEKYEDSNLEDQMDENATLQSIYPQRYKKYIIVNNIIIFLCCINLSLDYHEQSKSFKSLTDLIDFCFYCLFLIQIMLLIIVEKWILRRVEFWTKVEIGIFLLCSIGVAYQFWGFTSFKAFFKSADKTSDIFRTIKYLRIMVLIIKTPFFLEAKLILASTFRSLYNIRNVVGLWLIIVLIFAIMGFHLHSYKTMVDPATESLDMENGIGFQNSFDGIFDSVIFTLLTFYNEEWDYLMFQQYLGGGTLVVVWQLISICVGLILFSKYFMALLMKELDQLIDENFEKSEFLHKDEKSQEEEEIHDMAKIEPLDTPDQPKVPKHRRVSSTGDFPLLISERKKKKTAKSKTIKVPVDTGEKEGTNFCLKRMLYLIKRMIEHKAYQVLFVMMIMCTLVVMIKVHPHVDRSSPEIYPFLVLSSLSKSFFFLDLLLNIAVYGFFMNDNSYLRKSKLNVLNFIIVIVQIISFTSLGSSYIFMKIEKIRVLRVLMFVELRYKSNWEMRMTFHSFVQLLPKVLTLLAITILMYGYFALVLVKVYKDDFYSCVNYSQSGSIVTKNDCLLWGGDWVQQSSNTANLFNSVLFLFEVATMEGWISLMQPMMNLTGPNLAPVIDNNKYICIFFVFFFFFGNLIMLNVFVGLSVSNFKRLKDITTGEASLSKIQKMWLSVKSQIYRLKPLILETRPTNILRGVAYDIAKHSGYKIVQGFFFISFLISMSLFKTGMSDNERHMLDYAQKGFVVVLIIEYLIEFMAFGVRTEYKISFIFKNIVVIYCVIYVALNGAGVTDDVSKATTRVLGGIFISLQFFRYLSLLDQIPFAKKLLNSLMTVLPQTSNIALIILVTLFIYAIIGMELFAFLRPSDELDVFNQNYTDFPSALFALIKFSTMQSPIAQIADAAKGPNPNFVCYSVYSYHDFTTYGQMGCGNKLLSYIFFLSFHIFYSLLLMSTLMAVIVDSYSEVKKEESAFITKFVLEKVRNAWAKIDPEATGYIPYREFWMFTAKLLQIYIGKGDPKKSQQSLTELFASREEFLKSLKIPIYENQNGVLCFQFHEVIEALTRIYIQKNIGCEIKSKKAQKMFQQRQENQGMQFKLSFYTSSHVATLIVLKSGLRWWKKLATNEKGRMEYKNVIGKFANNKEKE